MEIEYKLYIVQTKLNKQWAVATDDYTTVYFSFKDNAGRLQIFNSEVKHLAKWCEEHQLNLTILNKKEII